MVRLAYLAIAQYGSLARLFHTARGCRYSACFAAFIRANMYFALCVSLTTNAKRLNSILNDDDVAYGHGRTTTVAIPGDLQNRIFVII